MQSPITKAPLPKSIKNVSSGRIRSITGHKVDLPGGKAPQKGLQVNQK